MTPTHPALTFAAGDARALPLYAVTCEGLDELLNSLPAPQSAWAKAAGFKAAAGSVLLLAGAEGDCIGAIAGLGDAKARARGRFLLASARAKLPEQTFELHSDLTGPDLDEAALGWLLAGYRYDRYATNAAPKAQLIAPEGVDRQRLEVIAAGEALTRDLINTPAADMGPAELEAAALVLAEQHGAMATLVQGEELLAQNFPMIHAVGRASAPHRQPRLIELNWGDQGPSLTLVGKGVCFDTGGLNLKPGASMGLMKKDMGGAANVLGLAHMIMALGLKLRLRVLIPAVENSVSADAFRPQDILTSRKGLTVEINNTDAEGRLVLADALALADEGSPDLIISMATLTGAARVAVGTDLAAFFASKPDDAATVARAGATAADPVWQLPFHDPYEPMIEPGIADLDNAPAGGFGGAITAALFLRRFVEHCPRYLHFDIMAWQRSAAPARPKGGLGQGSRALLAALPELLPDLAAE